MLAALGVLEGDDTCDWSASCAPGGGVKKCCQRDSSFSAMVRYSESLAHDSTTRRLSITSQKFSGGIKAAQRYLHEGE